MKRLRRSATGSEIEEQRHTRGTRSVSERVSLPFTSSKLLTDNDLIERECERLMKIVGPVLSDKRRKEIEAMGLDSKYNELLNYYNYLVSP